LREFPKNTLKRVFKLFNYAFAGATIVLIYARFTETMLFEAIFAVKDDPERVLLTHKSFLHLGSRSAVTRAFKKLTQQGVLLRIGRGLYVVPVQTRFGSRPPDTHTIIRALEKLQGAAIFPHRAAQANAAGLTTQTPVREVFVSSGPRRWIKLGNQLIEIRKSLVYNV
jgi:hypothetical protein